MVDSSDKMESGNKLEVPGVSALIGGENRFRFSLAIKLMMITTVMLMMRRIKFA